MFFLTHSLTGVLYCTGDREVQRLILPFPSPVDPRSCKTSSACRVLRVSGLPKLPVCCIPRRCCESGERYDHLSRNEEPESLWIHTPKLGRRHQRTEPLCTVVALMRYSSVTCGF